MHRAWAAAGLAPELLRAEILPGGLAMVVTEKLRAEDGWRCFAELSDAEQRDQNPAVMAALVRGHNVAFQLPGQVTSGTGVHGDIRPPK